MKTKWTSYINFCAQLHCMKLLCYFSLCYFSDTAGIVCMMTLMQVLENVYSFNSDMLTTASITEVWPYAPPEKLKKSWRRRIKSFSNFKTFFLTGLWNSLQSTENALQQQLHKWLRQRKDKTTKENFSLLLSKLVTGQ